MSRATRPSFCAIGATRKCAQQTSTSVALPHLGADPTRQQRSGIPGGGPVGVGHAAVGDWGQAVCKVFVV